MISTKAPSSNLRDGNPEQSPKLYSVVPWDDTGSILPLSSLATICLPGYKDHLYFLGVDPGLKGGIALLDDQLRAVWLSHMPTSSNGHDLDIHALASIISNLVLGYRIQLTLLEDPIAMPHQNVVSTLKTGEVYGITRTILELSGQGYVQVKAKEWQKAMLPEGTKGRASCKAASIQVASDLVGAHALIPLKARVPHDGIADAVCMAAYAVTLHKNWTVN